MATVTSRRRRRRLAVLAGISSASSSVRSVSSFRQACSLLRRSDSARPAHQRAAGRARSTAARTSASVWIGKRPIGSPVAGFRLTKSVSWVVGASLVAVISPRLLTSSQEHQMGRPRDQPTHFGVAVVRGCANASNRGMAELIVHRHPRSADRRLRFLVELDGAPVRELAAGETLAIEVAPGPHTARIYAGRRNCFEFDVVIEPGRSVELDVLSRNGWTPLFHGVGMSRRPPIVVDPSTGRRIPGRVVPGRFRRPRGE